MAYLSMGEAHRRITEYLNRFSDAVSFQDGASLKQLLSVSSNSPSLLSLADSLNVFQDANRLIKQSDKYSHAFLPEFRNWESAWALEALYVIAYEIRILAERADRELASNGKSPEKLKGAGSFLMKVFGVLAGKGPKRVGALYVTCQLFKIYFKLGTVHLCRSVIRSIETARIFDFEEFPKRDKVTYMYYTGRLEVFNENFPAADHKLSYALMHCNPHHEANIRFDSVYAFVNFKSDKGNRCGMLLQKLFHSGFRFPLAFWNLLYKRYGIQQGHLANEQQSPANQVTSSPSSSPALMILKYLIPVKLSIGILPQDRLLEKYGLIEYSNVVQALKRGDLRLLRQALQEHEDRFLRSGVFLVLEKLELQVYQRLLKKIYIIQKQRDPSKAHQMKLEVIVKALKWLEIDMDLDEVECIVAILIYKNLVKGYFAHKSKVVVLSKQDPFPKLNAKPVNS
ncbi:hypothetical protein POTOM_023960 [Populus tomentosa]|uniref:PCI domain-containing protein n=1 Tax=Populus tomentosa TaxID=118781 RepID=A0A8X7ZR63_POPTO|nr:hypothetical protein POTOM_023960 [Populus tomentosa]